jgi:O-antigen/teichoic acid export membrane protein
LTTITTTSPQASWRYWARTIGGALGMTGMTSLLTFVASTIFYRTLPVSDAAQYGLFLNISQLLMFFCTLGQANYLRRVYVREPLGIYRWRVDTTITMLISAPMVILCVAGVGIVYQFPLWMVMLLAFCTICATFLWVSSELLASQRHYIIAGISQRIPNALMLLPAVLTLIFVPLANLQLILIAQSIVLLIGVVVMVVYQQKNIPNGTKIIPLKNRLYGLVMLVGMSSTLAPDYGLVAMGGLLLADLPMASFLALTTLFRPVQLFHNVVYQITSTEVSRNRELQYSRLFMVFGGLFALIMIGGALVIPILSSLAYDGRYDFASFLIPYIAFSNAVDVAEILPRGYLYANAPNRLLNVFILWQACLSVLGLLIGLVLIGTQGLLGLVIATAFGMSARCAVSYIYFYRLRWMERQ